MRLALREMRRRPGRFVIAVVLLTLVAALLMLLGGLLDGLIARSIGAIEAQRADLVTFSSTAERSFLRSRIDPATREAVAAVPGVARVGGLGVLQVGARVPGNGPRDLVDVALFGYEIAPQGVPRPPRLGEAYADRLLEDSGVRVGQQLLVGPARTPVEVVGFVDDVSYSGAGTLWASAATWRRAQEQNKPNAAVASGVFQALVVDGTRDAAALARAVDEASGGATETVTVAEAADSVGGVREQRSVFNQIIGVTVVIAIVVIALFFALLTVERTALYGILKAIGARSQTLFGGVVLQAVIVAAIAAAIGGVLALVFDALIPSGAIPYQLVPGRVVTSAVSLVLAAVAGSTFSLRRVLRIDPASAIGSST
ncbi:MAG TPA: FtsX-like permease family protein [Acidimicrobiia bacterium]|nr:FtsX-like permease family protein [Acidimicrobiia bacterium]